MPKQKRISVISLGRKALSVAVASAMFVMCEASATGMGRLTVLSALGQPLKAEIEITSPNKDEIESLSPKLASPEAFKQANIDFNAALLSLKFAVEPRGSSYVIKVTSTQAMNEPFVDMLLEMTSSNGKLLREYTFLLDPAELRNSQSPQVASPNAVAAKSDSIGDNSAKKLNSAPESFQPKIASEYKSNRAPQPQNNVPEYAVKKGDTLGKIANAYRSEGISLDQVLVGLYRANPQAFIGKNMNRLKSGQILTIPDAQSIRSSVGSSNEAHAVVVAHAADFNAYRNKLAEHVERAPVEKNVASKQSATGSISAKVKELPTATTDSPDKLKLSKPEAGAVAKEGNGKGVSEEDKLAKDKAALEANHRLKELEKNVGDLQKLLDVKNKDMAAKEAELKLKSEVNAAPASIASPVQEKNNTASKELQTAVASAPVDSAVASSVNATSASAAAQKTAKRKIVAPPPPPPESSFFDEISDWLLPGGVSLVAVLAGLGFWTRYRKKKLQHFEDSILTGSSMKANSMFGSTGGQSVDTNNSVFNSNFAPSASQLDANEVDPVAEADVYIAYGRDSQAEEILKEALRTQPDRHAVRVKLLEIYFARKDARLFERLASELYGMTSGEGDDWAQAASMGIVLDPNNPLYAGGQAKPEMTFPSELGLPTQPLEDLDPDALLGNSLSRDMLEAISIIDTASHEQQETGKLAQANADAQEHKADPGALDFDLGLGDMPAPQIPEDSPSTLTAKYEDHEPEVDFGTIDFDFGDAKSDVDKQDEVRVDDKHEVAGLDQMSFDVPSIEMSPLVHEEPVVEEAEVHDEMPGAAETAPEVASAFEFDLSGIDLDLPSDAGAALPDAEAPAALELEHEEPQENAEMATKLDLAVAYHEIGDKEGARELLDEVLKGGTPAQKERANTMLSQMA